MKNTKSPYTFRFLSDKDNRQMLDILKLSPVESGGLSICFDREPDIFIMANLKYNPVKYIGIFKGEHLLGFGLIGYHTGNVSGKNQKVFHFSNVYMRKEYRNKGLFLRAHDMFFKEITQNACLGYALIMMGNKNAERFIGWQNEKYPYLPFSSFLATIDVRNILITSKKRESKIVVRKACIEDIKSIVGLLKEEFSQRLFAPAINENEFKRNLTNRPDFSIDNYYVVEKASHIAGVCAAWDCTSFKQIRILKYNSKLKWIKRIYQLFSALFKLPSLPVQGQPFKAVYITDCAIENRDHRLMDALLRKIHNDYRLKKFNIIVFGSYKKDKVLKAANDFINLSVKSNIYLFHTDKSAILNLRKAEQQPYIDMAFL